MAKILDFNQLSKPMLPLVMADEAKTRINVTTPTEAMVEELQATLPELTRIMDGKDQQSIDCAYNLAARLISYNLEGLTVTVEDLLGKYWPTEQVANLLHLLAFMSAYAEFISEIQNAKN